MLRFVALLAAALAVSALGGPAGGEAAAASAAAAEGAGADVCIPAKGLQTGTLQHISLPVGYQSRGLLVYIPQSRGLARLPLLLAFHGFHTNPWYFGKLAGLVRYAEAHRYILALPFGTSATEPSPFCCPKGYDEQACAACPDARCADMERPCCWNTGANAFGKLRRVDDVAMAKTIVRDLTAGACVDGSRAFALGFSMGSMMVHRLACEAADTFRGVAAISGHLDVPTCKPARPIAFLSFCGTADDGCYPSVNGTFGLFGGLNGCTGGPVRTYATATTYCEALLGCPAGVITERCLIAGLGDEVPGHNRMYPGAPKQPATNVDAIEFLFDTFTLLGKEGSVELRPANATPSAPEATLLV